MLETWGFVVFFEKELLGNYAMEINITGPRNNYATKIGNAN